MKNFFFIILFAFPGLSSTAQTSALSLKGVYQGKDLYIENPFSDDGVGFCVYEVYVNGELTRDEINSSAFAIDFSILGIERGESVDVILNHKEGCGPLVLNPEAIKPHSTFEIKRIEVTNNTLNWTSKKESGSLPFEIEQFRWNKWVTAGEVKGKGTTGEHEYSFKLEPYSGENKVRVKQIDYTGKPRYSEAVIYNSGISAVTYSPEKPDRSITFSRDTRFEVFDKYGNLVRTGFGRSLDITDLTSGEEYYLNYDNSFGGTFRKK
ncbi:hypothetical protein O3Q51_18000 [Cryomorphaceae bacterium 1068]|nr:hypothetical protein [Cryomorphaceae bacterium 1068]